MRKLAISLICALFALGALPAIPERWDVPIQTPPSHDVAIGRGESLTFNPRFMSYSVPWNISTGAIVALYWSTNSFASAPWTTLGARVAGETGRVSVTWTPDCDAGAGSYQYMVGVIEPSGLLYRARGTIRMFATPGFRPSTAPLPVWDGWTNNYIYATWSAVQGVSNALAAMVQAEQQARLAGDSNATVALSSAVSSIWQTLTGYSLAGHNHDGRYDLAGASAAISNALSAAIQAEQQSRAAGDSAVADVIVVATQKIWAALSGPAALSVTGGTMQGAAVIMLTNVDAAVRFYSPSVSMSSGAYWSTVQGDRAERGAGDLWSFGHPYYAIDVGASPTGTLTRYVFSHRGGATGDVAFRSDVSNAFDQCLLKSGGVLGMTSDLEWFEPISSYGVYMQPDGVTDNNGKWAQLTGFGITLYNDNDGVGCTYVLPWTNATEAVVIATRPEVDAVRAEVQSATRWPLVDRGTFSNVVMYLSNSVLYLESAAP